MFFRTKRPNPGSKFTFHCGVYLVSLNLEQFINLYLTFLDVFEGERQVILFFFIFFYFFFINLFCFVFNKFIYFYFWLCWVFVSVCRLSLVAASGDHSSSQCAGLSLSRPLLLRSTGSRRAGSVVVAHGPSCSTACGIFPDQGSNPCLLHWQADS